MLNEYIANGGLPDPSSEKQVATVTPPKQKGTNRTSSRVKQKLSKMKRSLPVKPIKYRLSKSVQRLPAGLPPAPKPSNQVTKVYGVGEFIGIVTRYPKGSRMRGGMITQILDKGYVKRTQGTIRETLKQHEVHGKRFRFDEAWNHEGRKPLLDETDLGKCAKKLAAIFGEKNGTDEINDYLLQKLRENGGLPEGGKKWCRQTLANYAAYLAKRFNLCLTEGSIDKTNARYTAENSLIGAMAQLVIVAMTHFYVVEEEDPEWRAEVAQMDKADLLLYKLVCHFHGDRPVRARPPHMTLSCDDTTDCATKGTQPDKSSEIGLVSRASLQSNRTQSSFHKDSSKKMNVRRVVHHVIGAGTGDTAATCITIKCNDSEMIGGEDFIPMKVKGLAPGGFGVNASKEFG